jgi:HTH-type transcriptional regulator, competence development regulator
MSNTTDNIFGEYIRKQRETLKVEDPRFSMRQLAARIGVEPSYLSKVERGEQPPPSEQKVIALAAEMGEDADVLLAMAGKVSSDLLAVIRRRPHLFSQLIREMKDLPDHSVLRLVREIRDGNW